jgi:Zn ribbon nucleic-acid-binding protein
MGSIEYSEECPQCGIPDEKPTMVVTDYYNEGEMYKFCHRCGYNSKLYDQDLYSEEGKKTKQVIEKAIKTGDLTDVHKIIHLGVPPIHDEEIEVIKKDLKNGMTRAKDENIGYGCYFIFNTNGAVNFGTIPENKEQYEEALDRLSEIRADTDVEKVIIQIYNHENGLLYNENGELIEVPFTLQ